MNPQNHFRFHYLLTRNVTLELRTNTASAGKFIGRFLFGKKLKQVRKPTVVITLLWNREKRVFKLSRHDGRLIQTPDLDSLLPWIDRETRWQILTHLPKDLFPVHSSALTKKRGTILLLGESGCGKSTALFELLRKGYVGLSDELNFIDLRSFRILPYYRSWILKEPVPQKFLALAHRKSLLSTGTQGKQWKPVIHYFFPSKKLFELNPKKTYPLRKVFYLKTRRGKKTNCRKAGGAEIIKWLADNAYVFPFRKILKTPHARKYNALFLKLFKSLPISKDEIKGCELQATLKTSFSDLIVVK